jgi:hypothetical protein
LERLVEDGIINDRVQKAQSDFNKNFKQRFGFEVTLKIHSLAHTFGQTVGKVEIYKKGQEHREKLAEVDIRNREVLSMQITAIDVAAEILVGEKVAIREKVETTTLTVSSFALALMDLSGTILSKDNKTLTLPDRTIIPITGANTASKNVTVEIKGRTADEKPTIIACTLNEENKLEGYTIILGNPTDFKGMSREEVRKICK